jgi:hypothetical protein
VWLRGGSPSGHALRGGAEGKYWLVQLQYSSTTTLTEKCKLFSRTSIFKAFCAPLRAAFQLPGVTGITEFGAGVAKISHFPCGHVLACMPRCSLLTAPPQEHPPAPNHPQ